MSELMDSFQQQHQEKLEQLERGDVTAAFLDGVRMLIADLRQAGEDTVDAVERSQLRALLRFWANVVYDRSGAYPNVALLPPSVAPARPVQEPARPPTPRLVWLLIGGAAVITMLAGGLLISWMSLANTNKATEPLPTPAAAPVVLQSAVGTGLDDSGVPTETVRSFCLGTSEIVANFVVQGLQPEVQLRWELLRNGQVADAEPAVPWGQELQYVTIRMEGENAGGVEPGQYELRLYAGDQAVARQVFEVLDVAPQVSGLQVADVPDASLTTQRAFDSGLRVVYLGYDYAGLCSGLRLAHVLYRAGQPIQDTTETWNYPAQGRRQVAIQVSESFQFAPGDYELVVKLGDREQGRVRFTVQEETAEAGAEETPSLPSAFGDITIALGVYPNGAPIFPVQDITFDLNTKVVYAIFDYQGMGEGVTWAAVWTRDGQEVARREESWRAASAGSEGTYWIAYLDSTGQPIAAGNYNVTLFLNGVVQHSADFVVTASTAP